MKRLCVYYRLAEQWLGKPVQWIVCKECQAKLRKAKRLSVGYYSLKGAPSRSMREFMLHTAKTASPNR